MAIGELAFSIADKPNTLRNKGTLICNITGDIVKSKWAELIAIGVDPESKLKAVPDTSKYFNTLRMWYPNASITTRQYRGASREIIWVTQRQASFVYWVVEGEMPIQRFQVMEEAWNPTLKKRFFEAEKEKDLVGFYNTEVSPMLGLRGGLGRDLRGDVDLIDTWMWGSGDKKELFITQLTAASDQQLKTFETYENQVDFNLLLRDISQDTIDEILNPNFQFEPRRNKSIKLNAVHKRVASTFRR